MSKGNKPNVNCEREYTPSEPQEDAIYVRDGRGNFIRKEVEDDVGDDTAQ